MALIAIPARDIGYQVVQYLTKRITYTDAGTAVTVGTLPANALVIGGSVTVTTAFNAGSTNVLDIGTSSDDDGFATDLALGTVGQIVWDELATSNDLFSTSEVTVTATPALSGTAATAGVGYVCITYVVVR